MKSANGTFYFRLGCGTRLSLEELDEAGHSVIPIDNNRFLSTYGEFLAEKGQTTSDFYPARVWKRATGVVMMTGPKARRRNVNGDDLYYYGTDVDIEKAMRDRYPDIVDEIVELYRLACGTQTPCIVQTKSGGLRLSINLVSYDRKQSFRDKEDGEMLIEFFSLRAYSRLDRRYRMLEGSVLNIPFFRDYKLIARMAQLVLPVAQRKRTRSSGDLVVAGTTTIGDLELEFDDKGRTVRYYPKEHCKIREHRSNNDAVSFYKHANGLILGRCHGCEQNWVEVQGHRYEPMEDVEELPELNFEQARQWVEEQLAAHDAFVQSLIEEAHTVPDEMVSPMVRQARRKERRTSQMKAVQGGMASPLTLHRTRPNFIAQRAIDLQENVQEFVTLEEVRDYIGGILSERKGGVYMLTTDTGSGKTFGYINSTSMNAPTFIVVPHGEICDEIAEKAHEMGLSVLRWKPRAYGIEHYGEENYLNLPMNQAMCYYPVECDAMHQRGVNPRRVLCNKHKCGYYSECKSSGYLSQADEAKNVELVVSGQRELFTNPESEGFFHRITLDECELEQEGDETIPQRFVIDEFDVFAHYPIRSIANETLRDWVEDWMGFELSDFGRKLFDVTVFRKSRDLYEAMRTVLEDVDDETRDILKTQMQNIPLNVTYRELAEPIVVQNENPKTGEVYTTVIATHAMRINDDKGALIAADNNAVKEYHRAGEIGAIVQPQRLEDIERGLAVISIEDALRLDLFPHETPEELAELPRVFSDGFTPLDSMETFYETYPHQLTAPIRFVKGSEEEKDSLQFATHPVIPDRALKELWLLSATANIELVQRAFPTVQERTAPPLMFAPKNELYMIQTGLYPRASLVRAEGELIHLTTRGLEFAQIPVRIANAQPDDNVAIISFKSLTDLMKNEWQKTDNIVSVKHYYEVEGLDVHYENVQTLICIGCPNLSHTDIILAAKKLFGNEAENLDMLDEDGEVNIAQDEEGNFLDSRIQHVWLALVDKLVRQAVGRLRLAIECESGKPKRVIMLTQTTNPALLARATLFDTTDIEVADYNVGALKSVVGLREADQRIVDTTTDPNVVMNILGCSLRTANKKTEARRKLELEAKLEAARQLWLDKKRNKLTDEQIAERTGLKCSQLRRKSKGW